MMKRVFAYGLIAGSLLFAGAAIAADPMPPKDNMGPPPGDDMGPPPPDGPGHWRHDRGDRAEMAEHFFREFDLNHDGKVTKAEIEQVNAQRFKDASGGGSTVTLEQFIQAHMKEFREREEHRFKELDKNGDGKLTQAEFEGHHADMFDHMDRNKDGVITKDEIMPPRDMDGPPEKPE
jgi:Ca2+-binding EF-hand superfamily protein